MTDREINKGWCRHELDADGQAKMMATAESVRDIKAARQARGWSQTELARRVGTAQMTISTAERGLRGVSVAMHERIQAAFG
jgi:ribosome-binding protein aMBF1 (putative translation factor)